VSLADALGTNLMLNSGNLRLMNQKTLCVPITRQFALDKVENLGVR
jgi:hypothetical protein